MRKTITDALLCVYAGLLFALSIIGGVTVIVALTVDNITLCVQEPTNE